MQKLESKHMRPTRGAHHLQLIHVQSDSFELRQRACPLRLHQRSLKPPRSLFILNNNNNNNNLVMYLLLTDVKCGVHGVVSTTVLFVVIKAEPYPGTGRAG